LTLQLLVDECIQARFLVDLLNQAGHAVLTVTDATLSGCADPVIFQFAIQANRVLLTSNCEDFVTLANGQRHPGILLVYQNANSSKDMSYSEIVKAIENLESTNLPLMDCCHVLNHYNY
jgi:predicted nuclease of predicted toxin-antitoxin system